MDGYGKEDKSEIQIKFSRSCIQHSPLLIRFIAPSVDPASSMADGDRPIPGPDSHLCSHGRVSPLGSGDDENAISREVAHHAQRLAIRRQREAPTELLRHGGLVTDAPLPRQSATSCWRHTRGRGVTPGHALPSHALLVLALDDDGAVGLSPNLQEHRKSVPRFHSTQCRIWKGW